MGVFLLLRGRSHHQHAALVVAQLRHGGAGGAGDFGGGGGPVAGAVVLREELLDAKDGRMVDQVAPTATRLPPGAQSVGPQSDAVVHVLGHILLQATRGRGRGHILCIAALDSTLLAVRWKTKPIGVNILGCLTIKPVKPYVFACGAMVQNQSTTIMTE